MNDAEQLIKDLKADDYADLSVGATPAALEAN